MWQAALATHWGQRLTLSFLRALNFFRHSTVSCLCIMEATVERCCGEGTREGVTASSPKGHQLCPQGGAQRRRGQGEAQCSSLPGALVPRATSYSLQPEATCPHCLPNLQVHHLLRLSTPPVPPTTWPSPSVPLHPFTHWTAPPLLMELLSSQGLRPLNHQHIPSHIALRRPTHWIRGEGPRSTG